MICVFLLVSADVHAQIIKMFLLVRVEVRRQLWASVLAFHLVWGFRASAVASFPITLEGPWGCRHALLWLASACVLGSELGDSCLWNSGLFTELSPQPYGLFQLGDFLITVSVSTSLSVMYLFRFLKPSSWLDFGRSYRLGKSPLLLSFPSYWDILLRHALMIFWIILVSVVISLFSSLILFMLVFCSYFWSIYLAWFFVVLFFWFVSTISVLLLIIYVCL